MKIKHCIFTGGICTALLVQGAMYKSPPKDCPGNTESCSYTIASKSDLPTESRDLRPTHVIWTTSVSSTSSGPVTLLSGIPGAPLK